MPTTDQQPAPKYKATEGRLIEDGAVIAHTLPPVAMALAARLNSHDALVAALKKCDEIFPQLLDGGDLEKLDELEPIVKAALKTATL